MSKVTGKTAAQIVGLMKTCDKLETKGEYMAVLDQIEGAYCVLAANFALGIQDQEDVAVFHQGCVDDLSHHLRDFITTLYGIEGLPDPFSQSVNRKTFEEVMAMLKDA